MIGLRFSGGLFLSPGFGNGVKMPICISDGGFPSFAVVSSLCNAVVYGSRDIFDVF